MPPPNVLFILADQHNAKVLGHKGHPDVRTPNLDALAAQGVRFDNAITQNPICTPSRVSFLSGQYCHNHGYYGLDGPNPGGLPNVLGHFRRGGYRTAAIGKIHCPEYWIEDDSDLFLETCGCSIGGRDAGYTRYLRERNIEHLEDHDALQEFGARGMQSADGRPSKVSFADGQEGWSVARAAEFVLGCKEQGRPFFVHVSLPKPHQCYTPAQEFWDLYDEGRLHLPPNTEYDMAAARKTPNLIASAQAWQKGEWTLFEPRTFQAGRLRKYHGYLGSVSHVDHAVGLLLAALDRHGLTNNTIVVYSSDHGDYACEHGQMEKAPGICADAITRIPMIWRAPGKTKPGHVVPELVEAVDVASTLCALAGLEAMETADGKDLSNLLSGGAGELHKVAVTEFVWSKSVRKGDWRLMYYAPDMYPQEYPNGFGELYDLSGDPWEMNNRFFDPACADKVRELRQDLLDWLITTTRPVTVHPPSRPGPQAAERHHNAVNADGRIRPDQLHAFRERNYI